MSDRLPVKIPEGISIVPADGSHVLGSDRSRAFKADTIVVELPQLRIIDVETFSKVLSMRPAPSGKPPSFFANLWHPLKGKWICPRCENGTFRIDAFRKRMKCSNARRGRCDCPPIDFGGAESLLYEALGRLSDGREHDFAERARAHYRDIVQTGLAERKQLKERIEYLQGEIRDLVRNSSKNAYVRANLDELAEEYSCELDQKLAQLQDMPSVPVEPDPDKSLLSLKNMLAQLQRDVPTPYSSTEEGLRLRSSLAAMVNEVRMLELGNDRYDVEFHFNVGEILGTGGTAIETITLKDRFLRSGDDKIWKRQELFTAFWQEGTYRLTDEEWAKIPRLPFAKKLFGTKERTALDVLITMAVANVGSGVASRLCNNVVKANCLAIYRGSAELEQFHTWMSKLRPRKDDWTSFFPKSYRKLSLRQRLKDAEHPLLQLNRCNPSIPLVPMTDEEWEGLHPLLKTNHLGWQSMRSNIDLMFEIIHDERPYTWGDGAHVRDWFFRAHRNGNILAMTNYFLTAEGKSSCDRLPKLVIHNSKYRRRKGS